VASTDWPQITLLYDQLLRTPPSPVVERNRAVAVAMCEGLEQGLCLIDDLLAREQLSGYEKALALASQEPDRRFLARRLAELK
jgi:RNA polymerase sigma-70 factor (ECF subfamily)